MEKVSEASSSHVLQRAHVRERLSSSLPITDHGSVCPSNKRQPNAIRDSILQALASSFRSKIENSSDQEPFPDKNLSNDAQLVMRETMARPLHSSAIYESFVYVVLKDMSGLEWKAADVQNILAPPVWDEELRREINTLPKHTKGFCFLQMLPAPAAAYSHHVNYSWPSLSEGANAEERNHEYHGWIETDIQPQAIRDKFKNWEHVGSMKYTVSKDLISLQQAMSLTFQGSGRVFEKLPPRIWCCNGDVGRFSQGVPIPSDMGVWQSLPSDLPYGSLNVCEVLTQPIDAVSMHISTGERTQGSCKVPVMNLLQLGHARVWQSWQQAWPAGFTMTKKGTMSNLATACFLGASGSCEITVYTPPPSAAPRRKSASASTSAAITTGPSHRKRSKSATARVTDGSDGDCGDSDIASPPRARRRLLASPALDLDALKAQVENIQTKLDCALTKVDCLATQLSSMEATLVSISSMLQGQRNQ